MRIKDLRVKMVPILWHRNLSFTPFVHHHELGVRLQSCQQTFCEGMVSEEPIQLIYWGRRKSQKTK